MGISKRKRADADADAGDDELAAIDKATKSSKKQQMLPSMIKNKEKRSAVHAKIKRDKKIEKRKQAKSRDDARKCAVELDDEPPPKAIPHTIENIRLDDAEARGSIDLLYFLASRMAGFMERDELMPPMEEEVKRRDVVDQLKQIVVDWVKKVVWQNSLPN